MASLDCLTQFEPGAIGSDSGNVIIPTVGGQFPPTVYGTFAAAGVAVAAFQGYGGVQGLFSGGGSPTVLFVGESLTAAPFASAGIAAATFIGTSEVSGTFSSDGVGAATFAGSTGADEDHLGLLI